MAGIFLIPCGWHIAPFSGNIITTDQVFGESLPLIEREPFCIHWNGETLTFDSDKGEIGKFHFKDGFSYEGKMDYSALELFEYIKPYTVYRYEDYLHRICEQPYKPQVSTVPLSFLRLLSPLSKSKGVVDLSLGRLALIREDNIVGTLDFNGQMVFKGKKEESGVALFLYFNKYIDSYLTTVFKKTQRG